MSERKLIPVAAKGDEENLCVTACDGACCKAGVTMALYPDEAERMVNEYGAQLELEGDIHLIFGYGSYELLADCPNLTITEEMGVCAVWGGSGWRPSVCDEFQPGSQACNTIRLGGFVGGEYR